MFHLLCIIFVRNFLWKNAEAAKISQISEQMSVFQRFVAKSRVACAAHQAVTIKAGVCCVNACNFSILACIVLAVESIYKILRKSRVFLDILG
jgi:hypothetical protein